ncbi:hypothetical protein AHMF7605_08560 [Adhaeribacter arboris]|uniref:Uncharacterized protein n=1 Tax=Adhaeribacter arboris TaxID=2072846 RepID=A0A2T2YDI4_9BACT|nr:tetratricopeptide repeat protein [Adhaeribacter arboris]PSR53575.1 hypothetical protein AHMF7605_08560 [Adhaeribacter arboris]
MDSTYYEQIEDYLNGEMSHEEKAHFEAALSADKELAGTFSVYRTIETEMRGTAKYKMQEKDLRNTLLALNKRYFENEPQPTTKIIPLYSGKIFKTIFAIAATILLLLVTCFYFFKPHNTTQLLADTYFKENLLHINQTISDPEDTLEFGIAGDKLKQKNTIQDSLETGITAYNNQEYPNALMYFQSVYKNHPEYREAKKYTGLVFLASKEYDKALQVFDELAKENVPGNSGLFLKALTYLQRNQKGDKKRAKLLLQQVVKNRTENNKEAEDLLKKL